MFRLLRLNGVSNQSETFQAAVRHLEALDRRSQMEQLLRDNFDIAKLLFLRFIVQNGLEDR